MRPGPTNSLVDVAGLRVGHAHRAGGGYLTGTTVVLAPPSGAVGGVDVRGAAPGTRETELLDPRNLVERVHAVVLSGGSAYGLSAACGVMSRLAAAGVGYPVAGGVVPIVPAAVIFDLGRGGTFHATPDATFGTTAYNTATTSPPPAEPGAADPATAPGVTGSGIAEPGVAGPAAGLSAAEHAAGSVAGGSPAARSAVSGAGAMPGADVPGADVPAADRSAAAPYPLDLQGTSAMSGGKGIRHGAAVSAACGSVGAGTGAMAGGMAGGVGNASVVLPDGTTVAALVVVNAVGSVLDPHDGTLAGTRYGLPGEFQHLRPPAPEEVRAWRPRNTPAFNTTIGVVATDRTLTKAQCGKLAAVAHDGLARAIRPAHTMTDGDTIFALATCDKEPPGHQAFQDVLAAGADVFSRAIAHAILAATGRDGAPAYLDVFPSALREGQP